uniref:Uncharacterized protein n=1 Tax=Rhizophora mucronata TaxID=61149 RepID=A0A2P2ND34_RHIMU
MLVLSSEGFLFYMIYSYGIIYVVCDKVKTIWNLPW